MSAENTIYNGTTFVAGLANTTYYINETFNCTYLNISDWCLTIVNGTLNGTYCFNNSYVVLPGGGISPVVNYTLGFGHLYINIYDEDTGALINFAEIRIITQKNDTHYENTTTTGHFTYNNLGLGEYSVTLADTDYYIRSYLATIYNQTTTTLNAYLVNSSETVIFTIVDSTTGKEIEDSTIVIMKWIGGSLTVVGVFKSDVTGRIKFSFNPKTSYTFLVTKSGYADKMFTLNPIIFATYEIRLTAASDVTDSSDFVGVTIYTNPKVFYEGANNFTTLFASASGELTNYGVNISYPGGTAQLVGLNSYGEMLSTPFTITGASFGDKLNASIYYLKSGEVIKTYSYAYDIVPVPGAGTIMGNRNNHYGMNIMERGLVTTIAVIVVGGGASFFGGPIVGGVMGLLTFGFLSYIGFISKWLIFISFVVGLIMIFRVRN